jgi:hypothetical protein
MNAETTDKTKTGMLADTDELEVIDQLVHQRSLSGSQESGYTYNLHVR